MAQENLSALMDGECSEAELDAILAEFESSEAMRQSWSRMCAVRDALSDNRVSPPRRDICKGVMAAIASESIEAMDDAAIEPIEAVAPVVAGPTVTAPLGSNVVPFPVRPAAAARSRMFQPLVGLAAAASIAGAVVLGGNSLLSRPLDGAAKTADDGSGTASSGLAVARRSASTSVASNDEPTETRWGQLDSAAASQLNGYMMEHSNYRAEQGMGGSLSYARMAVRTADYRTAPEQH